MAQRSTFGLVPMPQPSGDALGSLADLMRFASYAQAMKQREVEANRETEEYTRKQADRNTLGQIFSSQAAMGVQRRDPAFTGPIDPNPRATMAGWNRPDVDTQGRPVAQDQSYLTESQPKPLNREQVLGITPGHLRTVVAKLFDDEEENARKAQTSRLNLEKATRDALQDITDQAAGIAYGVLQVGGEPIATNRLLDQADFRFAEQPEMRRRIAGFRQQFQEDPSRIVPTAIGIVGQSERYSALWEKAGNRSMLDLATTAATDPDQARRDAAQATLDTIAKHEQAKQVKREPPAGSLEDYLSATPERKREIDRALATRAAAGRAPEKTDDPTLPNGVQQYILGITQKPGITWDQAQTELTSALPTLQRDHPRLQPVKANEALRKFFTGDPNRPNPLNEILSRLVPSESTEEVSSSRGAKTSARAPEEVGAREAQAATLIRQIRTIEAQGGDATSQREQLRVLRAQVKR